MRLRLCLTGWHMTRRTCRPVLSQVVRDRRRDPGESGPQVSVIVRSQKQSIRSDFDARTPEL
jgi:hypothetical protein